MTRLESAIQSRKETAMVQAYLRTSFVTQCKPVGTPHQVVRATPFSLRLATLEVSAEKR